MTNGCLGWQTREYIETRDDQHLLAGDLPIGVRKFEGVAYEIDIKGGRHLRGGVGRLGEDELAEYGRDGGAPIDGALIAEALIHWAGIETDHRPVKDASRIIARYGQVEGPRIVGVINRLVDDFYASDADVRLRDLAQMADEAAARFRRLHPQIPERGVQAIRWCYALDRR